jgi:hypothetical protein
MRSYEDLNNPCMLVNLLAIYSVLKNVKIKSRNLIALPISICACYIDVHIINTNTMSTGLKINAKPRTYQLIGNNNRDQFQY